MPKAVTTAALHRALAELCAERDDGGAGLRLEEVCERAKVGKATAYRGSPSFRQEFHDKIDAVRAARQAGSETAAGETGVDTRAAYRKLVERLTNQVQALTLQLQAERRANAARADTAQVLPFPGKPAA